MEEEAATALPTTERAASRASKRTTFPRMALSKVLPLTEKIYELGEGDPVPRLVVFDKLGKSPESGPSRMLIITSNAYGLTTGGYQAERLGITETGKAIVNGATKTRTANAVKALLANQLFGQFYERYKGKGLPSEPIGIDALKQLGGLNETDAKTAYAVFVENLQAYGFVQELSGRPTVVTPDMMGVDETSGTKGEETSSANTVENGGGKSPALPSRDDAQKLDGGRKVSSVLPQFNFNIQVQLPENATPETYDAIFKSLSEHLLKQYSE